MNDSQLTCVRNKNIGFIFQKYHLINKYTVLQNVAIPLILRGYSSKAANEIALERLEKLGMGERTHHNPTSFRAVSSK